MKILRVSTAVPFRNPKTGVSTKTIGVEDEVTIEEAASGIGVMVVFQAAAVLLPWGGVANVEFTAEIDPQTRPVKKRKRAKPKDKLEGTYEKPPKDTPEVPGGYVPPKAVVPPDLGDAP